MLDLLPACAVDVQQSAAAVMDLSSAVLYLVGQETPAVTSWTSSRPELSVCNKQQLLEDMRQFLQVRRGKQLHPATFPEAILNGAQLDLNALYRTVCSRGGFAMGSGVNWAGQVHSAVIVSLCDDGIPVGSGGQLRGASQSAACFSVNR